MAKRQLYVKLIANLVIPVLGYFFWNWSLYFILLFYMLDILAAFIVLLLKARKCRKTNEISEQTLIKIPTSTYTFISTIFFVLTIGQINLGMELLHPGFNFKQEIIDFLMYKELYIPQFIILIPLLFMMAFTSYKTEFILPKLYLHVSEKKIWKSYIKEQFLLISFTVLTTLLAVSYNWSDLFVLIVIWTVTSLYSYLQGMEEIKNANN